MRFRGRDLDPVAEARGANSSLMRLEINRERDRAPVMVRNDKWEGFGMGLG